MKKLLSILLVISCVMVLGACKAKLGSDAPKKEVTPTPAPSKQEQGTSDSGASVGTVTFEPDDVNPGFDLEEDVLEDEPSVTTTPTVKPDTQATPSGQATPTPEPVESVQPSEPPQITATAEPTAQPTEPPVISLPFDSFV